MEAEKLNQKRYQFFWPNLSQRSSIMLFPGWKDEVDAGPSERSMDEWSSPKFPRARIPDCGPRQSLEAQEYH